jgi:hypothetical protein
MTETWLSYVDRTAAGHGNGQQMAPFATLPEEVSRGRRMAQWTAGAVSVICAILGVLVVSVAAVVLGLT